MAGLYIHYFIILDFFIQVGISILTSLLVVEVAVVVVGAAVSV